MDIAWEIAQRELKRCLTEEKSRAHSAFKLAQIKQKPNENLRIFILRYQDLHSAATGKTAAEDTDPTHIIRFLGMMTNSEIARKITQKGIPEGMTLGQAFTRAIELEAGYCKQLFLLFMQDAFCRFSCSEVCAGLGEWL